MEREQWNSLVLQNVKKLKNIVIAEGVSAMDKSCFANCKKLKKVELPTTLKSIG